MAFAVEKALKAVLYYWDGRSAEDIRRKGGHDLLKLYELLADDTKTLAFLLSDAFPHRLASALATNARAFETWRYIEEITGDDEPVVFIDDWVMLGVIDFSLMVLRNVAFALATEKKGSRVRTLRQAYEVLDANYRLESVDSHRQTEGRQISDQSQDDGQRPGRARPRTQRRFQLQASVRTGAAWDDPGSADVAECYGRQPIRRAESCSAEVRAYHRGAFQTAIPRGATDDDGARRRDLSDLGDTIVASPKRCRSHLGLETQKRSPWQERVGQAR